MATQTVVGYSLAEYLELELQSKERHEFHAGQIVTMAGGTKKHSRLAVRCTSLLEARLGDRCEIYESSMKLYIPAYDLCVYPDAMAVTGEPEILDGNDDVVLNPSLVIEVLSPSTANYDKASKLYYYQSLPSVTDCLLIDQKRISVAHSRRVASDEWITHQYTSEYDELHLVSCSISLRELYAGLVPIP